MNRIVYAAAWAVMALAAVCAVAAQQDWTSLKGGLAGAGLCLAALGAALMHPPSNPMPPP
jgi:urea transporter